MTAELLTPTLETEEPTAPDVPEPDTGDGGDDAGNGGDEGGDEGGDDAE